MNVINGMFITSPIMTVVAVALCLMLAVFFLSIIWESTRPPSPYRKGLGFQTMSPFHPPKEKIGPTCVRLLKSLKFESANWKRTGITRAPFSRRLVHADTGVSIWVKYRSIYIENGFGEIVPFSPIELSLIQDEVMSQRFDNRTETIERSNRNRDAMRNQASILPRE